MSIPEMTRWTRGKILIRLAPEKGWKIYATLEMIQAALREAGIVESIWHVRLHILFLAARGYVEFRQHALPLAALTERGWQLIALRSADPEILWEEPPC